MKRIILYSILLFSIFALSLSCSKDLGQLRGLKWVDGYWEGPTYDFLTNEETGYVFLRITPSFYQLSYDGPVDELTEKREYSLKKEVNENGKDLFWIDEDEGIFFFNESDPENQVIDIKGWNWQYTLTKDKELSEITPLKIFWIKNENWIPWVLFAIAIILFIFLLIWLVKKLIRSIKRWHQNAIAKRMAKAQEGNSLNNTKKKKIIWIAIAIALLILSAILRMCDGGDSDYRYEKNNNYNSPSYQLNDDEPKDEYDLMREELAEINKEIARDIKRLESTTDPTERRALNADIDLLRQRAAVLQRKVMGL